MAQMEKAIIERDYNTFAQLTMQDSDDFHAVSLSSHVDNLIFNDYTNYNSAGLRRHQTSHLLYERNF